MRKLEFVEGQEVVSGENSSDGEIGMICKVFTFFLRFCVFSGKSTLVVALFRMVEACGGSILIDDVDISTLGLEQLRSSLSIIPQDPVLFSGPLRANLDPFAQFTDTEVEECLRRVHLLEFVQTLPEKLQFVVAEGGNNFSQGQKQVGLMHEQDAPRPRFSLSIFDTVHFFSSSVLHVRCFDVPRFCCSTVSSRCSLSNIAVGRRSHSSLLLSFSLSEATSSIDATTDGIIQASIRENFSSCTILTIAHRVETIIDNDTVVMIADGKVEEGEDQRAKGLRSHVFFHSLISCSPFLSSLPVVGSPFSLLSRGFGSFHRLVSDGGGASHLSRMIQLAGAANLQRQKNS